MICIRKYYWLISLLLVVGLLTLQSPWIARADSLPPEAYVSGVSGKPQKYHLDCEVRSAVDWAAFFGVHFTEDQFLARLPRSDNPNEGFVGDPNGSPWGMTPPNSYGVHAAPIASVLQGYGLPARERVGMSWDEMRSEIAAGRPVIVWVIGLVWRGTPVTYQAQSGATAIVAAYEHSMMVVGYTRELVHLLDSASGGTQPYALNNFLESWKVLGNMAVIAEGPPPPAYEGDSPAETNPGTYTVRAGDYLSDIARKYNTDWVTLASLNNLAYPYMIYPGQVLQLPGQPVQPSPTMTAEPTQTPQPTPTAITQLTETAQPSPTAMNPLTETALPSPTAITQPTQTSQPSPTVNVQPTPILQSTPTAEQTAAASPTPEQIQPTAAPPMPTIEPPVTKYTVQRGDTLVAIARRFNTSWEDLAHANNLAYPYIIFSGQVLKLPTGVIVPARGEETFPIEEGLVTPPPNLTPPPIPEEMISMKTATAAPATDQTTAETYTVQHGDYLMALARRYGLSWQDLANKNGIGYPYIIYPGQVLRIY